MAPKEKRQCTQAHSKHPKQPIAWVYECANYFPRKGRVPMTPRLCNTAASPSRAENTQIGYTDGRGKPTC